MSSIVSSTWQFVKRHKGKFVLLGAAGGGFFLLNRYLSAWEKQWETSASRDFVSEVRKKEMHFENTIQTCNATCASLAPKILDILDQLLSCDELLEQLKIASTKGGKKKVAGEKILIWDQLKIKIFTRLMSEIYCVSLFVCYLRVQLAVMGGYTYLESQNSPMNGAHQSTAAAAAAACSQGVQHKYLSMLQSFYQDGIQEIIVPVQEAVEEALGSLSLKERLALGNVREIFEKIKASMAFSLAGPSSSASRYLIKPERITSMKNGDISGSCASNGAGSSKNNSSSTIHRPINGDHSLSPKDAEQLRQMLTETQEIIESDDFRRVLNASIDIGFSIALDMVLGCFVRLAEAEMPFSNSMTSSMLESQSDGPDSLSIVNGSASPRSSTPQGQEEETLTKENFSNPHAARIPLAKLLPALRSAINERKKPDEQLVLVRHLLCLDVLNCFAANIYEAFCEPNNSQQVSPDQPSTSKAPYQNGHAAKIH